MIAAIGLLYLDEESTFWCVRALCITTSVRTVSEKIGFYIKDKNRLYFARYVYNYVTKLP